MSITRSIICRNTYVCDECWYVTVSEHEGDVASFPWPKGWRRLLDIGPARKLLCPSCAMLFCLTCGQRLPEVTA